MPLKVEALACGQHAFFDLRFCDAAGHTVLVAGTDVTPLMVADGTRVHPHAINLFAILQHSNEPVPCRIIAGNVTKTSATLCCYVGEGTSAWIDMTMTGDDIAPYLERLTVDHPVDYIAITRAVSGH